jgi:hypothetical protein
MSHPAAAPLAQLLSGIDDVCEFEFEFEFEFEHERQFRSHPLQSALLGSDSIISDAA